MVTSQVTPKHRPPLTNMSNKLCYYRCFVTKKNKTEEYGYGLRWKEIQAEVQEHYDEGADAVELEVITKEQFYETLPRP